MAKSKLKGGWETRVGVMPEWDDFKTRIQNEKDTAKDEGYEFIWTFPDKVYKELQQPIQK